MQTKQMEMDSSRSMLVLNTSRWRTQREVRALLGTSLENSQDKGIYTLLVGSQQPSRHLGVYVCVSPGQATYHYV